MVRLVLGRNASAPESVAVGRSVDSLWRGRPSCVACPRTRAPTRRRPRWISAVLAHRGSVPIRALRHTVAPAAESRSPTVWRTRGRNAAGHAGDGQTPTRLTAMVAGGPLASLVTGGLAWWTAPSALAGGGEVSTAWLFSSALGRGFGLGSLLIGVVTVVPGRTSGFLTDGPRLRLLAAFGPGADRGRIVRRRSRASSARASPAFARAIGRRRSSRLRARSKTTRCST